MDDCYFLHGHDSGDSNVTFIKIYFFDLPLCFSSFEF